MKTRVLLAALLVLLAVPAFAQGPESFSLTSPPSGVSPLGGPNCNGADDYSQPLDPANFFTARTSDEQPVQQVWEDIVDGGGAIVPFTAGTTANLRVWGLSLEFAGGFVATCLEDHTASTPYDVTFYADAAGVPAGAPSFTTTATPTAITDTGIAFAFTTIFEYDLALAAPAPPGYEWISIVRQTGEQTAGGNDCYWLWVDEDLTGTYDDAAFSVANGPEPTDQTMCIGAGIVPPDDPTEVPTSSTAGLLALFALLATGAFFVMRRAS